MTCGQSKRGYEKRAWPARRFRKLSYQKPEPWQPSYRSPVPSNVPSPEEFKDEATLYRERAAVADSEYFKNIWTTRAEHRDRSPITIRSAGDNYEDGVLVSCAWMKAKHVPECDLAYQKLILRYLSDALFIGAGPKLLGLEYRIEDGPKAFGLSSTLDHSIWFYMYKLSRASPRLMRTVGGIVTDDHG